MRRLSAAFGCEKTFDIYLVCLSAPARRVLSPTGTKYFSRWQFYELVKWCSSEMYVRLEDQVPIQLGTHSAGAESCASSLTRFLFPSGEYQNHRPRYKQMMADRWRKHYKSNKTINTAFSKQLNKEILGQGRRRLAIRGAPL